MHLLLPAEGLPNYQLNSTSPASHSYYQCGAQRYTNLCHWQTQKTDHWFLMERYGCNYLHIESVLPHDVQERGTDCSPNLWAGAISLPNTSNQGLPPCPGWKVWWVTKSCSNMMFHSWIIVTMLEAMGIEHPNWQRQSVATRREIWL